MRIPRRSEAKSTSQHTNNQKAESWNGGWIQEKQCETELWKMPGLDMPHGPSPRESSSVQLLHPLHGSLLVNEWYCKTFMTPP